MDVDDPSRNDDAVPDGLTSFPFAPAALINEWFVPKLGIVAKTEVYDASGQLMARNHLAHVKAP